MSRLIKINTILNICYMKNKFKIILNLKTILIGCLTLMATTLFAINKSSKPKSFSCKSKTSLVFIENNGQVRDQNHKSRPDVLFSGTDGKLTFHLKNNGISYQLFRVDTWKKESDLTKNHTDSNMHNDEKKLIPGQSTIYRLDINWLNANVNAVVTKQNPIEGFNNYYLENCPDGALNVKSYQQILYQNIYNGIDLKWYQKDGHLKYDYIVSARADYKKIQFEISGADKISINKKGELVFKTPLGDIIEQAPLVKQNDKLLTSKWVLTKNVLSFDIQNINYTQPFIIDPVVRSWATYYGGNNNDYEYSCSTDATSNVYMTGMTFTGGSGNAIATSGSHQVSNGGGLDAFIVKFNSAGIRQWATYYGDYGSDCGYACSTDGSGNVYLAGNSQWSGTAIATLSSHQSAHGGGNYDAFLVKFNSSGARQWSTYYGGAGEDHGYGCSTDVAGNVYLSGSTSSSLTAISTLGSHQSNFGGGTADAFLVKFNSLGIRQWGTYYGGIGDDFGYSCVRDGSGALYLAGSTSSSGTVIATLGSHQSNFGGGSYDAFLVKFNNLGVRQWGTYYGGAGYDNGYSCARDAIGNVYLTGGTESLGTFMATIGSHQSTLGGGAYDAYLVKFNSSGIRQWGTYYGGTGDDYAVKCATDAGSNVYLSGVTSSSLTGISTIGSHQSAYGGGVNDAYLVKFNSSGVRQWGTYYGGIGDDAYTEPQCATDAIDNIYLASTTTSSVGAITTLGSHQSTFGGGVFDSFLVKFIECASPTITVNSGSICIGQSYTIMPSGASTYTYSSGSAIVSPTANTTYSVIGKDSIGCFASNTAISTVTVNALPIISVNSGTICSTNSFTMIPSGASSYIYSSGSAVTSPTTNTTYTVIGASVEGCTNTAFSSVTVNANPIVIVNNGSICSGKSFTIIPTGASTYAYSGGSAIVTPSVNSSYSVVGTSSLGCVSSNTAVSSVTVNTLPIIAVNSGIICSGNSFTMIPSGANSYSYSSGSAVVYPTINSNYIVTGANVAGCTNTVVSSVTVNANPIVVALTSNTLICVGNIAVLSASSTATSYTWNTGATTMSVSVSPTVTSTYTVIVSNAASCIGSSTVMVIVNACAGINEIIGHPISIYPNPNNGEFTIELTETNRVNITNVFGQVILNEIVMGGKQTLDIKNHANGIYFVQFIIDGKQQTIKLIKE